MPDMATTLAVLERHDIEVLIHHRLAVPADQSWRETPHEIERPRRFVQREPPNRHPEAARASWRLPPTSVCWRLVLTGGLGQQLGEGVKVPTDCAPLRFLDEGVGEPPKIPPRPESASTL